MKIAKQKKRLTPADVITRKLIATGGAIALLLAMGACVDEHEPWMDDPYYNQKGPGKGDDSRNGTEKPDSTKNNSPIVIVIEEPELKDTTIYFNPYNQKTR